MAAPSGAQPPQQGQQGQGQDQQSGDALEPFRNFAKLGMALGQQFPETAQYMAEALKQVQKAMTAVAGNGQRFQERQAPPQA
jgi:hypothetical protein